MPLLLTKIKNNDFSLNLEKTANALKKQEKTKHCTQAARQGEAAVAQQASPTSNDAEGLEST